MPKFGTTSLRQSPLTFTLVGTGAVSKSVENQIRAAASPGAKVTRFAGKDRYETSAKIASCFNSGTPAFVATGRNYADAVIAGAPAAKAGAPVILTNGTDLKLGAKSALSSLKPSSVNIVGGTWSAAQRSAVASAASGAKVSVHSGKNRYGTAAAVAKNLYGSAPKARSTRPVATSWTLWPADLWRR